VRRCEAAAASASALVQQHAGDGVLLDAVAWEVVHSLGGVALASPRCGGACHSARTWLTPWFFADVRFAACSAAQEVAAALAGLAGGCPPRDALPLFLEALQVSRESGRDDDGAGSAGDCADDGGSDAASASPQAWHLRAALTRGVCVLLARAPRRRWEAAVNAAQQVLLVARDASAALAEHVLREDADAAEHTAAALDAALQFSNAAASAADATAEPSVVAHALPRLLLRLLAAAAPQLPAGAAHVQLVPLCSLLHARGVVSWAALDAVAMPPSRAAGGDSNADTDEDDEDERAARARAAAEEERHVACGAALLAHAWLTGTDDGSAALLAAADVLPSAAPHACVLLSGAAGVAAAELGAELAVAAAAAGCTPSGSADSSARIGASDATPQLLSSLAAAMARSPSPAVRERAYAALMRCLDAHATWARLEALRALLRQCRDPAVAALLFRRIKDDAAAAWPEPPFGGPPAVRMVVDWLTDAARDAAAPAGACSTEQLGPWSVERAMAMAEGADAVIGALNALRFALLRDAGAARNASGLAAARALHADVLRPLHHAAAAAAAALDAAPLEDQCLPALLAVQTVQELCERTTEAADAAEAACGQTPTAGVAQAAAHHPKGAAPGLKRGFLA
jgi:hypothetical protein